MQITNIGTTEFCQGKTMRWGLAWTFDSTITFPVSISVIKFSCPIFYSFSFMFAYFVVFWVPLSDHWPRSFVRRIHLIHLVTAM